MTSVEWGLPIVANYYLAGLAAGSYITYYLWQGFGLRAFRPVAKLAWISAAVFAVASPLPVLAHLGQPGRSYYLFASFHWTSSLAWAGPILVAFILAVLLNGRFFFYPDVVLAYRAARGFRRKPRRILRNTKPPAGAVPPTSAFGLKVTGAIAFVLALFFGYPGLELGILGSRPLWANPATPLMFLVTAVVVSTLLLVVGAFAQKYGFVVAGQVANPPGGQTSSLWPTVTEIVELAAGVGFLYLLLQVALWISPWRTVTPEPESPTEAEVPA